MKPRSTLLASVAAFFVAGAASAAVIDFEGETQGGKPNGYAVAGHPGVTFSDTQSADLIVDDFGNQGLGTRALAVFFDDTSTLKIAFASAQTFVSLSFGNDQEFFDPLPFFALLQAFNGATLVGTASVGVNGDDIMNQSISVNVAGGFDSVTFAYVNANDAPIRLIEIVDNINYESRLQQVPAPATLALVGAALLGLGASRRRKG